MKNLITLMFILAAIVVSIGEKVAIYHFCILVSFLVILAYIKVTEQKDKK